MRRNLEKRSAFCFALLAALTLGCSTEADLSTSLQKNLSEAPEGAEGLVIRLRQGTVFKRIKDGPYAASSGEYGPDDLCFLPYELQTLPLQRRVRTNESRASHSQLTTQEGFLIPALYDLGEEPKTGENSAGEGEEEVSVRQDAPPSEIGSDLEGAQGIESENQGISQDSGPASWVASFSPDLMIQGQRINGIYEELKAAGIRFANEQAPCPFTTGWVYEGHVEGAVMEGGFIRPDKYPNILSCLSSSPRHLAFNSTRRAISSNDGRGIVTRRHAACDFHGRVGDEVVAIADGTVWYSSNFYLGTCEVTVRHTSGSEKYLARYGEIHCGRIPVSAGEEVKKGQVIGYVGNLRGISASMLHFELYRNATGTGALTSSTAGPASQYRHIEGQNFGNYFRRRDLMNPTKLLRKWKK